MLARPSQLTLEQVMAVPGVGAQVMSSLPVPDRVRLRRTCRIFLAVADASLAALTELFGEDVAAEGCTPGTTGLSWLLSKCPKLQLLSVASRADHDKPWQERKRDGWSLTWPIDMNKFPVVKLVRGVVSLEDVARRFARLESLNLAGCEDVTDAGLMAIARSCPGLRAVDVSFCDIGDESIQVLAESCRDLLHLAVSCCYRVKDASMASVATHCRMLEALDATQTGMSDEGITHIAQGCCHLRRLRVPSVTDAALGQVAAHCPQLELLDLWSCNHVTNAGIKQIAAGCPHLRQLVAWEEGVADEGVVALAQGCPGLSRLSLGSTSVTDEGVSAVARHCPQLRRLELQNCKGVTDASITLVARNCVQLECLVVAGCRQVTDASVCWVAEKCRKLRKLVVSDTGVADDSVPAIAASCHELEHLDMLDCHLYGSTFLPVAKGCPKLEELGMPSMNFGTDRSIGAVGRFCTRLRVFRASPNSLGDSNVLKLVSERGPQLRYLDFSENRVTDKALAGLGRACPRLQQLYLSGCEVSDRGMKHLAKGCKALRYIDIQMCPEVTSAGYALVETDKCTAVWDSM
eukprot:jgi/Mesvir1/1195/Mv17687-RA.1